MTNDEAHIPWRRARGDNVWQPEWRVVMIGYQAQGTLGRRLVDSAARIRLWQETIQYEETRARLALTDKRQERYGVEARAGSHSSSEFMVSLTEGFKSSAM